MIAGEGGQGQNKENNCPHVKVINKRVTESSEKMAYFLCSMSYYPNQLRHNNKLFLVLNLTALGKEEVLSTP